MNAVDLGAMAINSFQNFEKDNNRQRMGNFDMPNTETQEEKKARLEKEERQNQRFFTISVVIVITIIFALLFWLSKYIIRHIADIGDEIKRLKNKP